MREFTSHYPNKTFGEIMDIFFKLIEEKYSDIYILGNQQRGAYLRALLEGNPMEGVLGGVLSKVEKREDFKVHPMMVEDDVIELVLRRHLDIVGKLEND